MTVRRMFPNVRSMRPFCFRTPNNFTSTTRLVMDVTIGHSYTTSSQTPSRQWNPQNVTSIAPITRQRLAFAPMVANTLGQFGPNLLQFLWNLADHHAQLTYGLSIDTAVHLSTEQEMDYRKLRGLKCHENRAPSHMSLRSIHITSIRRHL